MEQLLKIGEQVLVDRLINKHSPVTHKSKIGLFAFGLAGILFLMGIGVLLYACYVWFTMAYTPIIASMLLSALLIAASVLLCMIMVAVSAYQRRKVIQMRNDITSDISAALHMFEEEIDISQALKDNPKTTVALATLAGFIAAEKIL